MTFIITNVTCPFNTGSHGQRCKASHPSCEDHDPNGEKIGCPYSFDYPYAKKYNPNWKPPLGVKKALNELMNK
ncbi:MAG: hypothetical protein V1928_02900 [Parcubacteria group bacterium]